ncbi:hypothetical protein Daus18300_008505 [Diaporthe australafricana]|uniref:Uncharacterized protein n=1 Tax=Diaporthe australafricana TaxID=127596 RepID=A0ABR3WI86_9PEZI
MTVQEGDQVQRPHAKRSFPMAMDFEYLDEYELNEYKLFLKRRICNIGTLRANMGHANFIAMDTEHGQGFSSIGLAFATKLEPIEHAICPVAMADALGLATGQPEGAPRETAKADSICFNIRGFERSQPARERIWGPPDQDIEFEAVASKVTGFVQRCKEAEPEKPLTLVTYSSRAELSAIASLFPQLYGLFSNWVDL